MLNKLKAKQLSANTPKRLYDGGGLMFHVRLRSGGKINKNWVLRFTFDGKRCEMGLGSFPTVSLAEARELRDKYAKHVAAGRDPRQERDGVKHKATQNAKMHNAPTFAEMAEMALEAKSATLKHGGRAGHWLTPLRLYVYPHFGAKPVTKISQQEIVNAFKPIWRTKHPSAKKAMDRLNITMKHAVALGYPVDLNDIVNAKTVLGGVVYRPTKHAAIPYAVAPAYYQQLPEHGSGLATKMLMLTGVRSQEIRFARIENLKWNEGTLTAHEDSVKATLSRLKDHTIPLSTEAIRLARVAAGGRREGLLFPSNRGRVFSDNSLSKPMRESEWLSSRNLKCTPHGMRGTFKTFILEQHKEIPREVVKLVLSHRVEDDADEAYTRTDLIEEQRCALERWGRFLTGDTTKIFDDFSPAGTIGGKKLLKSESKNGQ